MDIRILTKKDVYPVYDVFLPFLFPFSLYFIFPPSSAAHQILKSQKSNQIFDIFLEYENISVI